MYYEHKVVIKLTVRTLADEVSPKDVEKELENNAWDYDIEDTSLITPVEVVAKIEEHIRLRGVNAFKCDGYANFALELLDVIKADLEDFQEAYQEAL